MKHLIHNGQLNFNACVSLAVLATVAVALRLAMRRNLKQAPQLPEVLCVLGLLFFYAYNGAMIWYMMHSPDGNFDVKLFTSPLQVISMLRILFISEIFFSCGITAVKLSILCFYHSLFNIHDAFRRAVYVVGVVCLLWLVLMIFIVVFQCHPIHAFWDTISSPQYCWSSSAKIILGYEISNLFVDVAILVLPLLVVRTLRLPLWRKISVAGIFLLGGFVCVASIVRITQIWNPPDPTNNIRLPTTLMWSTIQLGTAIICCCLPTYGPLLKSEPVMRVFRSLKSSFGSKYSDGSKRRRNMGPPNSAELGNLSWHRIEKAQARQEHSVVAPPNKRSDFPVGAVSNTFIVGGRDDMV